MKIMVNGDERDTSTPTVASLLDDLGLTGRTIATALNGLFLPVSRRAETRLAEGDRIELLAPMQGG